MNVENDAEYFPYTQTACMVGTRSSQKEAEPPEPSSMSLKSDHSAAHPRNSDDGPNSHDKRIYPERKDPSVMSSVSMKSDNSMGQPLNIKDGIYPKRKDPSVMSSVSMKSDNSMGQPLNFKDWIYPERKDPSVMSSVSMKSDNSMGQPLNMKDRIYPERKDPSVMSSVSMKSDNSMGQPLNFKDGIYPKRKDPSVMTSVSMKSDNSMGQPLNIKDGVDQERPEMLSDQSATDLELTFKLLEENIVAFVKTELKRFLVVLKPGCASQMKEEELEGADEKQKTSSREAFLKITLHFLKTMRHQRLADLLYSKTVAPLCQQKLKSNLKNKFQCVFEGIPKAGKPTLLNQIYTELYITEGGSGEVNDEHEVRQIEAASRKAGRAETSIRQEDIFKGPPGRDEPIRTVMTKGVAGIGKTVLTQKFTLDWAEGKANQDIHFMFPFTFRELNVLKERKFSLVELVHHFFTETKAAGICSFEQFQVVFIFDGLDECRLPLDFHSKEPLTDATEPTSVDVLLTNLIRGELLPSARLWITTRPAAANQIPAGYVGMVTEVRGFTDPQKEEYFRKRFRKRKQASRIISLIETSRSLHIMCHIPVFCWITATVLEDVLETREGAELPSTLTEMYIHFLVVQAKVKKLKYEGGAATDPHWSPESRKMIESLGKLAFEQLQKGNLIFYESDLTECGIDISAASVYSGVFTQIFREERGLYQEKVFCFIHLSVQEFLAALHVRLTFINSGLNLMEEPSKSKKSETLRETLFYQSAVDKALESPNGHLDLFLRFLLGLSLQTNQRLLRGLLTQTGNSSQTNQKTVDYIKKKIRKKLSAERSINLFHCLNELNDRSLVEEIQQALSSGSLSTDELSPAHWSALVFILLSSGKHLDVFDLKKYSASEEALLRLLPVVKASNKALLSGCNLSKRSCKALSSILSQSSSLTELDLSNNDLKDSGVKQLSDGLQSPQCRLESLSLSGCLITEEGCVSLNSAVTSNPSHLRELDLSYNHPGDAGVKLLRAALKDPNRRLDSVRVECGGAWTLQAGLRKYACDITLDSNTAHRHLKLSEDNSKVSEIQEQQPHPDHPERFDFCQQLLCEDALTGRCYWEVEWEGMVCIGVTYKGIDRKKDSASSLLGGENQSWTLYCNGKTYSAFHNKERRDIRPAPPTSNRVGVFLDWPSGTLSFYRVSSKTLIHLHTFSTTFTEPVYPAFRIGLQHSLFDSSVSLCKLKEEKSIL
ncbi:protein NLRC3-like [Odontesthes bonariensis]|uniref:protein NLRC3-like n=1 Tax=Odontesthes bonariensis TaxID=219752 RepID=UPI003F5834B4